MKPLLLGALIAVPVAGYFYHGFDKTYPVKESKIPAQTVLYLQHVGNYSKMTKTFEIVERDLKSAGGAGLTKFARPLTHRLLEALKPEAAPYRIPDTRCGGFARTQMK